MALLQNIYTHRKVADSSSKACDICYKPTTSVLVAPDNKDFFFACLIHLKDKGFASPIVDEAAVAAKKKQLEAEIEQLKHEFEDKQKKKREKEENKQKDEVKSKDLKDGEREVKSSDEKKKKDDESIVATPDEEPRVFALQKTFFQQRIDKKRSAEIARRNRERLQNPNLFPSVPKGTPGDGAITR